MLPVPVAPVPVPPAWNWSLPAASLIFGPLVKARLPLIVSFSVGVLVPIPMLPLLSTVRMLDEVAMVRRAVEVAGVEVPIIMLPPVNVEVPFTVKVRVEVVNVRLGWEETVEEEVKKEIWVEVPLPTAGLVTVQFTSVGAQVGFSISPGA